MGAAIGAATVASARPTIHARLAFAHAQLSLEARAPQGRLPGRRRTADEVDVEDAARVRAGEPHVQVGGGARRRGAGRRVGAGAGLHAGLDHGIAS